MKPISPATVWRFAFVLVGALLLGGCATFSPRGEVGVSVVDLRPTQASLFETGAALTLRFTNETATPLSLKGSAHKLYLNGSYVGRAVSNDSLALPALGTVTQTVTLYLENLTLVRKAVEFSKAAKAIDYRLESRLYPEGQGSPRIRATSSGALDVRGLIDTTGSMGVP